MDTLLLSYPPSLVASILGENRQQLSEALVLTPALMQVSTLTTDVAPLSTLPTLVASIVGENNGSQPVEEAVASVQGTYTNLNDKVR